MPPKTQSIAVLRAKMAQEKPSVNRREIESAKRFEEISKLVTWLRDNWDGTTMVLPLPPNYANDVARKHWTRQVELKAQYKTFIETLYAVRLLPKAPDKPFNPCYISATFFVRQTMDNDGLHARLKWPQDLLREMGWMIDDKPKHLIWTRQVEQQLAGKTPCRIEFTLKEQNE